MRAKLHIDPGGERLIKPLGWLDPQILLAAIMLRSANDGGDGWLNLAVRDGTHLLLPDVLAAVTLRRDAAGRYLAWGMRGAYDSPTPIVRALCASAYAPLQHELLHGRPRPVKPVETKTAPATDAKAAKRREAENFPAMSRMADLRYRSQLVTAAGSCSRRSIANPPAGCPSLRTGSASSPATICQVGFCCRLRSRQSCRQRRSKSPPLKRVRHPKFKTRRQEMSHELTRRGNGAVEMAFRAGTELPWHFEETRPQQVPADASIDDWVHAAGMEWRVLSAGVEFAAGNEMHRFDGRRVLHRSDTLAPLGIVSDDYCILHPREVITFFDDLLQSVGLELDTAGTLFGGRRFWALAKIGEDCIIDHRDAVKGYLLLTSSADGTRATEARFTSVRVVCNNTLTMSDRRDGATQLRVTHRVEWQPDHIKHQLGLAPQTFAEFMAKMRRLADHRLSDVEAERELQSLLQTEARSNRAIKGAPPALRTFTKTMELFRGLARGTDQPGFAGTAWGLLNSFTETVDHGRRSSSDSHRFANAVMGAGEHIIPRSTARAGAVMLTNDFRAFCARHGDLLEKVRELLLNLEGVLALGSARREVILDLRLRVDREIEELRVRRC